MRSRILKQFSTVLMGRLLAAGVQAVSILLLAKWVSVESFGVCVAMLGLMTTLQTLGDVGATTFVTKEVATHGANVRVLAARRLSRHATTAIALAGLLVSLILAFSGRHDFVLMLPLWGWLVFERITEIHIAVAMGMQRPWDGMLNLVTRRMLSLALFALFFALGIAPLLAFSLGYLLGSSLALLFFRRNRSDDAPAGAVPYKQVFAESRHYWLHSSALQARNVDTFVVGLTAGSVQAAFYGFGARLLTPLRMVPTALAAIMLPHAAREGGAAMTGSRLVAIAILFSVPYLGLVLLWPVVIPRLFAATYAGVVLPLQIMSAALSVASCTSIVSSVLQGWGHGQRVSRVSVSTTGVTIALVAVGSSLLGAVGAAIGFAVAACMHIILVTRIYLVAKKSHG